MTRFYSIQVVRGVAAILVLLYHQSLLATGEAGVDIFFVISGFIMGTVATSERPTDFINRRIIRIVPLYWAVTFCMCLPSLIPGFFAHFSFTFPTLVKSLFFIPYYDLKGNIWPLLVPGWTLNYEMFFYVIFALGLTLHSTIMFSVMCMLLCTALGLLLHPASPILYTYTDKLLLEFAGGLLLAQYYRYLPLWFGILMLMLSTGIFISLSLSGNTYTDVRLIAYGIPALALVAGIITIEKAHGWPRLKILETVGDSSYSLYLLHGIVIGFIHTILHCDIYVENTIIFIACISVGLLCYQFFERPVTHYLKRRL